MLSHYYHISDSLQEAVPGSVYAKLWSGIENRKDSIVANQAEGLGKVRSERYGYIGEKTPMLTDVSTDCTLAFIREEFFKSGFGFAMPEGWPYTKYFSNK